MIVPRLISEFQVIDNAHALLGEGPCWNRQSNRLIWADIDKGLVHFAADSVHDGEAFDLGQPVSAAFPTIEGNLICLTKDGVTHLDVHSRIAVPIVTIESDLPSIRMNDGAIDSMGRLWAGSMATNGDLDQCALYRLDDAQEVIEVISDVSISNGIGWSPDDSHMYFIDTPTQRVDIFDYDAKLGDVKNRRPFVHIPSSEGKPDGLAVDSEGGVWVALYGGSSVRRYSNDGQLDTIVELPVSNVTNCCFGGRANTTLFITSATRGLSPSEIQFQPFAGAVFSVETGVTGLTGSMINL